VLLADAEPHLAGFHQFKQLARLMASGGATEIRLSVDSLVPGDRLFVTLASSWPARQCDLPTRRILPSTSICL